MQSNMIFPDKLSRRLVIAVVSSMMLLAMNPVLYVSLSLIFSAHLNVPLMARYGTQAALRAPEGAGRDLQTGHQGRPRSVYASARSARYAGPPLISGCRAARFRSSRG